jgi:enamine deaminase RidA (YjgF/YER057c/UK114 family)
LIFVSGQLPVRAGPDHSLATAPFAAQVRQALDNLLIVLKAAQSDFDHVAKVTVYIAGIELWPECNTIFAEIFGDARPARSIVPVPGLHYGYLIEIDAIAVAAS